MLKSYCDKAGLGEQGPGQGKGLSILDLGCGWGSLGLYLAEKYPEASIKMLSNSRTQKIHIDETCQRKGFGNVEVCKVDVPRVIMRAILNVLFSTFRSSQEISRSSTLSKRSSE